MSNWGQNNDAVDAAAATGAVEDAPEEVQKQAAEFAKTMVGITKSFSAEGRAQLCHLILEDTQHIIATDLDNHVMVARSCDDAFVVQFIRALLDQLELPEGDVERIRVLIMGEEEEDVGS